MDKNLNEIAAKIDELITAFKDNGIFAKDLTDKDLKNTKQIINTLVCNSINEFDRMQREQANAFSYKFYNRKV